MRTFLLTSAALLVVTACTSERVIDASEWETSTPSTTATPAPPLLPPTNPANLANTPDFTQDSSGGQLGYYFATPSGRWQCAILPKQKAGCGATGGALSITGAPATVPNAQGVATPPNAIIVGQQGDPYFAAVDVAQFAPPAPANVLPFGKTLAVAGFRCNIQESTGVSCVSEASGEGFTFSADGFTLQYSEVPVGAP